MTAYELLSGRWPFESDDTEILARVVQSKPVPAIDGVTDEVLAVLRKAMAKQPSERFPNCSEFVQWLAKPGEPAKPIVSAVPPVPKLEPDKIFLGTKAGGVRSFTHLGMKFCWCAAGEFLMGSPESDSTASDNERPQHRVTLTNGFWLGQSEVTQEQWERVMGSNPSDFKGRQNPVEQVSWEDAENYCRKLTVAEQAAGRLPSDWSYRLPTEAEWEYACRAGTTTQYSFGDSEAMLGDYAWFEGNAGGTTHAVGKKRQNAWGLHDMYGNVSEWCADWGGGYQAGAVTDPRGPLRGPFRVRRGGSWINAAGRCRSAYRSEGDPSFRDNGLGFRLALSASELPQEAR